MSPETFPEPPTDAEITNLREQHKAGWEAAAKKVDKLRHPLLSHVGVGDTQGEDIMRWEAERINQAVDAAREQSKDVKNHDHELTNTEALQKVQADLEYQEGMPRYSKDKRLVAPGPMTEEYQQRREAVDYLEDEERYKEAAAKLQEALEKGDVAGASEIYQKARERPSLGEPNIPAAEVLYFGNALSKFIKGIQERGDTALLSELVDSPLAVVIAETKLAPNMPDGRVIPRKERYGEDKTERQTLGEVLTKKATADIKELFPKQWEYLGDGEYPHNILARRLKVSAGLGILSYEELTSDKAVREAALDESYERFVQNLGHVDKLYFPGWTLERMGLTSRQEFANDPRVRKLAAFNFVNEVPDLDAKVEGLLKERWALDKSPEQIDEEIRDAQIRERQDSERRREERIRQQEEREKNLYRIEYTITDLAGRALRKVEKELDTDINAARRQALDLVIAGEWGPGSANQLVADAFVTIPDGTRIPWHEFTNPPDAETESPAAA